MKIKPIVGLAILGLTALCSAGWAQVTTPATDSAGTAGGTTGRQPQKTTNRNANLDSNPNAQTSSENTSSDGQYRQSAAANGTAVNNSNSTNYNSNNVTNAPTGVGSNPSVSTDPTSLQGNAVEPTASPSGSSTGGTRTTTGATKAVITGVGRSPEPAVVAGSTERNASIHDFIASSPNYVTLQNALQSVDLYTTLKDGGPYTLFAPSNNAFKKLPASMQSSLLEGRNTEELKQLLSYHLVQGTIDTAELTKRIKAGGGKAQLQTLAGGVLVAKQGAGGNLTLTDEQGKTVTIESPDKPQSNGVVHGIDAVLLPKAAAKNIR